MSIFIDNPVLKSARDADVCRDSFGAGAV